MRRGVIPLLLVAAACSSTAQPPAPQDAVEVVTVLDGDSLVVRIDGEERDVRLLGINTPERDECFSLEAKTATGNLVGPTVRLAGNEDDQFGRLLRYVYTEDGLLINQQLVADGLALALSSGHALLSEFKAAEASAFADRLGRWQSDACGPHSSASVSISDLEPDAPGDDSQNPNGEWVEIANRGNNSVDLSGWSLRDESSRHRFEFPAGFELGAGDEVRVLSGCGEATKDKLYWCDGGPIWSNGGDTAYLLDPAGNVVGRRGF